jgi:hypothetical protein
MRVGDVVDVFDGDLRRWVRCTCESIGPTPAALGAEEVCVFKPLERLVHPGSELPLKYGIPWPDGQHLTRVAS